MTTFLRHFHVIISFTLLLLFFAQLQEIYNPKQYSKQTHYTLCLDRNFSEEEKLIIIEAALEWTNATSHIIEFDVIVMPSERDVDLDNSIFVVKTSIDDPRIVTVDQLSSAETLGLYIPNGLTSVLLVTDRIPEINYKAVVLHEFGHALGLKHLKGNENVNSLMFPYTSIKIDNMLIPTGSDYITRKDLEAFCEIYKCDYTKLSGY